MRRNVSLLPAHQYYYYGDAGEILIGTYSAESLREAKLAGVLQWYEKAKQNPVEFSGHLFDFDEVSQQRVSVVALAGIGSPTGTWTTYDNIDVPADAAFMQGLFVVMLTRVGQLHSEQRRMKTELAALNSAEDIANYEVPVI